ncbi:MAG: fumarylacetoacetase [Paracoccaceae bacterium]
MGLMKSWLASANEPGADFPLNNLPYGVFSVGDNDPRCGVAIGDMILDMMAAEEAGLIALGEEPCFDLPYWNDVMELGPAAWADLRAQLIALLEERSVQRRAIEPLLVPLASAQMHMPFAVSEYTDFYAGKQHAINVGTIFRGAESALPPNWLHIPIGYNGRASTVVISGTDIHRPNGQTKAPDAQMPSFGPCKRLDFELELGAIVGTPSTMGAPISVAQADAMIFGYVLLNDWSARDIQAWEYQPLGPFQAKAFATSISPWIVTAAALAPFRALAPAREMPLLPYLQEPGPMHFDINLEASLQPQNAAEPTKICATNARELYYSAAQQLAHHASAGCAMSSGDLLGSGTISGAENSARGSLLELCWGGAEPITLDTGETRSFLEDGDQLTLHGFASGDGYRIGFGACEGTILPAPKFP